MNEWKIYIQYFDSGVHNKTWMCKPGMNILVDNDNIAQMKLEGFQIGFYKPYLHVKRDYKRRIK